MKIFCIDSVLKHCAANRKRRLSVLPNVGPYIYDVKISGFTRSSIYIYIYIYIHDISSLRVNTYTSGMAPLKGSFLDPSELLEIQIEWVVYHIMCEKSNN